MKKLSVLAIMLVGGIAFASSMAIPWFADNAAAGTSSPPTIDGGVTVIYLKNNVNAVMTCEIYYYNEGGDYIGPVPGAAPGIVNTFTIAPNSSVAFRPVALDPIASLPGGSAGGLEGAQGVAVPNRPRSANSTTPIPGTTIIDSKKNGSCSVKWVGAPTDVQGALQAWAKSGATIVCYGHLLPPGA